MTEEERAEWKVGVNWQIERWQKVINEDLMMKENDCEVKEG